MTTIGELIQEKARERGVDLPNIKVRERVHIEKFDKTGPEPVLVETIVIENGTVVERHTLTE